MNRINLLLFILVIVQFSCKRRSDIEKENEDIKKKMAIEINERIEYYKNQCDTIYSKKIYNQINDTVNKWISLNLHYFNSKIRKRYILTLSKYIYFNTAKDKFIAFMVLQSISKCTRYDSYYRFGGEKINKNWNIYFMGKTQFINYESSLKNRVPFTYEYLEDNGIEEVLNWEGYKNKNIDDKYFDQINWEDERIQENYQ